MEPSYWREAASQVRTHLTYQEITAMATNWTALVTTFAMVGSGWVAVEALQDPDLTSPTVQIVQTVGCATADGTSWYLTNAME